MIQGFVGGTMLDRWFSVIRLPLSWRQFHQLPRNPAYKYEYLEKAAWLSPRPKYYSARLKLPASGDSPARPDELPEAVGFRRLEDRDWPRLSRPFAASFHRVQPFASLGERRRLEAARDCLKSTRDGRDGPIIRPACHVAFDDKGRRPVGAILVTLVPPVDLDDLWGLQWKTPPPPDCIEQRLGHAHLTWIFVGPRLAGSGIGSALLTHASARPHRAGLHRAAQLVHAGQRVEHALALAQRLRAAVLLRLEATVPRDDAGDRAEGGSGEFPRRLDLGRGSGYGSSGDSCPVFVWLRAEIGPTHLAPRRFDGLKIGAPLTWLMNASGARSPSWPPR